MREKIIEILSSGEAKRPWLLRVSDVDWGTYPNREMAEWRGQRILELTKAAYRSESLEAALPFRLARVEKGEIVKALCEYDGNITKAATDLGISRQKLQTKMRKYDLRVYDSD